MTKKLDKPAKMMALAALIIIVMLLAIVLINRQTEQIKQQHQILSENTPAPTMAPPPLSFRPQAVLLRIGSIGPEVIQLQQRLKDLGFYTGEVDGKYYEGTAGSVKEFQAQHGLEADGLAGEKTLAVLYSPDARRFAAPSSSPQASASPSPGNDAGYTTPSPGN